MVVPGDHPDLLREYGGWVIAGGYHGDTGKLGTLDAYEAEFLRHFKSTYRVLLTRGLRGCYVYFMDAPTRGFFLSRTEGRSPSVSRLAAESPLDYGRDIPR